jgi:hypothetical protein
MCLAQWRETKCERSAGGGPDRDPYHERDPDDHRDREPSADAMRALLLLGADRSVDVAE